MISAPADAAATPRRSSRERPAIFERPNWSPESAAGRLLARPPGANDERALLRDCARIAVQRLGGFARVLDLLPAREQERAVLLFALVDLLFATARGAGTEAARVTDLDRIAFVMARALRGEPVEELFARRLAAEARRRSFTRQALDDLFDAARRFASRPRPETCAAQAAHAQQISEAFATALLGGEPTPAVIDLGAGLLRLATLCDLPNELREQRCSLPAAELPEPVQYRTPDEVGAVVGRECMELRKLLLKGARAAGEVPLSFRRPVAFLLPAALSLLGLVEDRPPELARRAPKLGGWTVRRAYWRARFTPLI
ncbi:MAG: squalene/phytoene synthase family protein [Thermoanaerobaculia bacterium]